MYTIELDGGLRTVTTTEDIKDARRIIELAIAQAWQKFDVNADAPWYIHLPTTIFVPVSNDFERRYWSQLAPEWMPEPEDANAMVARVNWRLAEAVVEGRTMGKLSFFFEDHPTFEIYSSVVR